MGTHGTNKKKKLSFNNRNQEDEFINYDRGN